MGSREERAETRARRCGSERKPRAISSLLPAPLLLAALRTTLVRAQLYSAATIFLSIIKKIIKYGFVLLCGDDEVGTK